MLNLYSDATFDHALHMAVAVTMVLDENTDTCLAFFPQVYGGVATSIHAELLGVYQSLQWMRDNRPNDDWWLLCDNSSIVQTIADYPRNTRVVAGLPAALWFRVFNLLDELKHPVTAQISAHQKEHNPNKSCDMLCSRIIRYIRDVKEPCMLSSLPGLRASTGALEM